MNDVERKIARRLNEAAPKNQFLLGKRSKGTWVGYCLASGDLTRPTTWVINYIPINLADLATKWGVALALT